jgi:hypothetical protein
MNGYIVAALIVQSLIFSVNRAIGVVVGFGITATVLIWGLMVYGNGGGIALFGHHVSQGQFVLLCLFWFAYDIRKASAPESTTVSTRVSPAQSYIPAKSTGKSIAARMSRPTPLEQANERDSGFGASSMPTFRSEPR